MLKLTSEIYSRKKTFIDFEAQDLASGAVWFNNCEFARYHNLDGKKILAVLTGNVKNKAVNLASSKDKEGYAKSSGIVFFRACDIKGVMKAGASLTLDGELYTISEAILEGQVWKIVLEANR